MKKGIVGIRSLKDLLKSIDKRKQSIKELDYTSILLDYFTNINQEHVEEISKQIATNFSSNLCDKHEKLVKTLNKIKFKSIQFSMKKVKEFTSSYKVDYKTILTTQERREIDELKDCTFQ